MPPPVAVAVNTTGLPLHIVVAEAEIETFGVTDGLTVIVIGVAVAVGTVVQVADEVITTVTWSPLPSALLLYVVLLVPTLLPFSFHW